MQPIRLGIVDRFPLVCQSLAAFFSYRAGFEVVWTAINAASALQSWLVGPPDAVLLDADLRDGNPFELARRMTTGPKNSKVVVLTADACDASLRMALDVKVSGYLLKKDPPEAVIAGISEAVAGRTSWSPTVRRRLRFDSCTGAYDLPCQGAAQKLTIRQIEIVRRLALGASAKEVARELHLSEKSVSSHTYRIMKRLNIHDRVGLVRMAIREGLVTP